MPTHLQPTAEVAPRALLPTDPGTALALAQELLVKPMMANHARGLWGYVGAAEEDGELLTIQAVGVGGPSSALVLAELAGLGLGRAVLLGEAVGPSLGRALHVARALSLDGTSRALGHEDPEADPALAGEDVVATVDVAPADAPRTAEASAADLTCAGLLAAARRAGVAAGALLVVTDDGVGEELDHAAAQAALVEAGRRAAALLARAT